MTRPYPSAMRTVALPLAAVALLLAAGALAGVGPAGAHGGGTHGNHLRADAQLSDDGSLVVETAFLLQDGYVAIHVSNETGQPGEVVAHRRLAGGFHSPLDVQVDRSFWADQSGTVRLWAVLHADDGDGEFEPNGDDAPLYSFGRLAGSQFAVAKAEGKASVVAAEFSSQRTTGEVTLPRVSLPADGFVVFHDEETGERAGSVGLSAGTHENVTAPLDRAYLANVSDRRVVYVEATLYRDDGDGDFDPAADEPVRVGNETVGSTFAVDVPADLGNGTDGTATTTTDGGLVNTPSTTESLVNTPSATTPTATPTATTAPPADTTPTEDGGESNAGAPGLGIGLAVVALLAAALLAFRRR